MKKSETVFDIAVGWLKNTTIAPEKIANHVGLYGDNKVKFITFAKKYRNELWENPNSKECDG